MDAKRVDSALRALARTSDGPFRVVAYSSLLGETEGENAVGAASELKSLVKAAKLPGDRGEDVIVVETCESRTGALTRKRFRNEVLARISPRGRKPGGHSSEEGSSLTGRGTQTRAREALSDLGTQWSAVMKREIDRKLDALEDEGGTPAPHEAMPLGAMPSDVMPPDVEGPAGAADPDEAGQATTEDLVSLPTDREGERPQAAPLGTGAPPPWVLFVPSYDHFGPDAESIAGAIAATVTRAVHVVVPGEGVDTRTREGRLVVRHILRLGSMRADLARAKALVDLAGRRAGLRVYGPVPFGFRKEGDQLLPVPEEIALVKEARSLARQELPPGVIAAHLNGKGATWHGEPWTRLRVIRVLANPIYDQVLAPASPTAASEGRS